MSYHIDLFFFNLVQKSQILLILICFSCQPKHDLPDTIDLHSNWQFKKVNDTIWQSAIVPGNVFSDLLEHNLIKDPFIGNNEEAVHWVSDEDWEYRTMFSVDEQTLQKKHLELNFEGLDTYASVYLNDSLILKANNAFRTWKVNVKSILKSENELRLLFEKTSKYEDSEKAKLPYELPEGNRIFTRKAQFQYGWDWGPKLNTSGIWRPISLEAWNDYKINDLHLSSSNKDSLAQLVIDLKKHSSIELDENLTYEIFLNDSLVKKSNEIHKGFSWTTNLNIANPKLWWPHNIGEPYLYDIKIIVKDGRKILDSISVKHGIRTIDLVTEKDSIGESFYFRVNDLPVYAKGANYIPQHSFQNKVSDSDYEKLLDNVVATNMNMLRVWGGGIYENDIFYDLCDEKGILLWQDFMFACAMYPGDIAFLGNVKREAEDNIKRLRNHASLALWCGNNESSEGWHRWGWQADRSVAEQQEIWSNYLKVFDSILPNMVTAFTDTDYWESSPKFGRGNLKYEFEGDAHDWWIWHDAYPFEHLEKHVPRFMSEFGFQSFPTYKTLKFINQNDSIIIDTDAFKNHQKHSRGFQLIDEYMQRYFPVPNSPEDYVYMSQVLQAYGITKGIEAHRRAKPRNMGTLYWQLNDCWPAVSWSSIDFFGNKKALHYQVEAAFENILISSAIEKETLNTWVVNDNLKAIEGILELSLMDFSGKILWNDNLKISANGSSSEIKYELDINSLDLDWSEVVYVVKFNSTVSYHYFLKPKYLKLEHKDIDRKISKTNDGFTIELKSTTLQKDVCLYTTSKGQFSNNYFDMLPNKIYTLRFDTKAKSLDNLQLKSLNNFIR